MIEANDLIQALKKARQAKGLSQRELGKKIGVPQSHISKTENGGVDLQLSSLVQLARALDLEVQLIPKKALPAVRSVVKGFPRDRTQPALSLIKKAQKQLELLGLFSQSTGTTSGILENASQSLDGLRALNYDTDAFVRLQQALAPISTAVQKLELWQTENSSKEPPSVSSNDLRSLGNTANELRKLRNSLVHQYDLRDLAQRPAYNLGDDDD